jgi:hypothetical protein
MRPRRPDAGNQEDETMTTDTMAAIATNLDIDIEMRNTLEITVLEWSRTVKTEELDEFFAGLRDQLDEIRLRLKKIREVH